ncbi:MAG: hypothetical protein ACAH83_04160 [Alphaproteobacteria bacterium]
MPKTMSPFRRLSLAFALVAGAFFGAQNANAQAPQLEYPHTAYSERTQELVKEFNAAGGAPVIMMDRDLLALNLALRHIDDYDPPDRARLIAELAKAQTGLDIDAKRFTDASYNMTKEVGSTWSPGYGPSSDLSPGFCTVFGQDPDADGPAQQLQLMNMNGLFNPVGARLLNPIPLKVINDYTDYHEFGHCLFYVPPPKADADRDAVVTQRHKQEMFGDIFASLMLARDGVTDFAERYARVRLAASAMAGIDDEYLHATWDGLQAAQRDIDARGVDAMKKLTIMEIRDIALSLIGENALDLQTVRLAAAFQHSQYDEAVLKEKLKANPSLQKSADYALKLKLRMNEAITVTVDMNGLGPDNLSPLERIHYYMTHDVEVPEDNFAMSYKDLALKIRDELLTAAKAGATEPTPQSLARALTVRKDALRQTLEGGDEMARKQATRELNFIENAFRQALNFIDPPKPAPKPGV